MANLDSFIVELVETAPYGITRRGIFYKAVSAGFYPGTHDVHYKELGKVLKRLRKAEKLNEDNIIDGTRIRENPYVFGDPSEFLQDVESSYQKDLWEDQDVHLEVFSEKDAMSAILSGVISKYRITYNMVRGYSSDTLIYKAYKAWRELPEDKEIQVLYLGDHDPSGKNIEEVIRREIRNRLWIGSRHDADDGSDDFDCDRIKWTRVASTKADLDTYFGSLILCKPGDKRTPAYKVKYGDRCLEVDAIDNVEIVSRLENAILRRIDKEAWDAAKHVEVEECEKLKKAIKEVSKQFSDL